MLGKNTDNIGSFCIITITVGSDFSGIWLLLCYLSFGTIAFLFDMFSWKHELKTVFYTQQIKTRGEAVKFWLHKLKDIM